MFVDTTSTRTYGTLQLVKNWREPSNGVDRYAVKCLTVKIWTFITTDELYEILPLSKITHYTVLVFMYTNSVPGHLGQSPACLM